LLAVLPSGMSVPNGTADRKSRFAADMRRVLETVRACHAQPQAPSILVVSPQEAADTTMVALQLAAAAAATQRVLLIDADMHERTLAAIIPGESDAGLVDVAVGRKVLAEAVVHDARTNINIMPLVSPKSYRLGRMRDADIEAAFDQTSCFDLVIVAAGTHDSDPAVRFFAGLVDHVVLVVAAGNNGQGDVDQLIARLAIDPRKVRGTILTGAKTPARSLSA
jgi:Mrp family chromosome partitioning ATPase